MGPHRQPKHIQKFLKEYAPRKEIQGQGQQEGEAVAKGGNCLLVVSSTSGFGNASRLGPKVAEYLGTSFQKVTVVPTQHAGHVYEIMNTEENLHNYQVAVILGGDGAFSEAVNGMLTREDSAKVVLAHCPGGSGCSTAGNTIGVWKGSDIEKACDIICKQKIGKMDVIEVQHQSKTYYSISCVSGGIYTDIVDLADKHYKWTYHIFGPTARYAFGLIHAFIKYGKQDNNRKVKYTIQYDENAASQKPEKVVIVELPTLGFAVYNDGRVTEHSRFSKATVGCGSLSLAIDKHYMGLGNQLKYVGDLAKEAKLEGEAADNRFERDNISSIKVEPLIDDADKSVPTSHSRPLAFFLDGEKGRGNKDYMVAPFSAKVLPGKLDVIVA